MRISFFAIIVLGYVLMNVSCVSPRKFYYFNDISDTVSAKYPVTIEATKYTDPVIQISDNLAVNVITSEQGASNTPIALSGLTNNISQIGGYLVDKNGMIELALIGLVKVAGLTTSEACQVVKEKAKEFYREPIVKVRFLNFDVSFLGEMHGFLSFPNEKVNIIEAIAQNGDVPLTGRKTNVLLVRTENDTRTFVRLDLTSSNIFKSPYFYLRQRDVIYVKPTRYKIQSSDNQITRNISIISSIISIGLVFLAFRNFK